MFKSKYVLIALLLGIVGIGGVATLSASHTNQAAVIGTQTSVSAPTEALPTEVPTEIPSPTALPTIKVAPTAVPTQVPQQPETGSSTDTAAPAGATAQCNDGTYSYSQHRSGTCSHHGGVSQWL